MTAGTKITIIGGGVTGYPAAIKAARLGAAVTLIEKDALGGVCLNRGCIPTKALLHAGEVLHTVQGAGEFGIQCGPAKVDFKAVVRRKRRVVEQLRIGVERLLKAKRVRVIQGTAELTDAATVRITETGEKISTDRILIASGAKPVRLNFEGCDGPDVLDSNQVLELDRLPKSLVIIGGGVIGVEFAQIFSRLGVSTTILELLETLVPGADKDIARALEECIRKSGTCVVTQAKVEKILHGQHGCTVFYTAAGQQQTVVAEKVVLAVGRQPATDGLGIERIGLAQRKGAVTVNDRLQTNIPHIYAAGDVTGGIMLAHLATAEGECAVRNALGDIAPMNYQAVPACVYTQPEVASVGLTEEEAAQRFDIAVGRFPFHACGKAQILDKAYGMVKIVSEKKFGGVLGVHIIGPQATNLIAEAVLGMNLEMTVEELAQAIHPHPTLSEAVMESALTLCGGAIHLP
jgi:dihydrolipoamide dehydrogenase